MSVASNDDEAGASDDEQCNVMVRGLPRSMDSAALAALGGSVRPVVSARVMVEPATDRSRGFGFGLYHSPADARAATRALHRRRVGQRTLTARLAHSSLSVEPPAAPAAAVSHRLFVRGFPAHFTNGPLSHWPRWHTCPRAA